MEQKGRKLPVDGGRVVAVKMMIMREEEEEGA